MATQVFGRLFSKTLTLTAIYSRSLSTLSGAVSRRVLLQPSIASLIEKCRHNYSALKLRNGCDYYPREVIMQAPDEEEEEEYLINGEPNWDEFEPTLDDIMEAIRIRGERKPTMDERREPTKDEIIDSYVKTLAKLVGSEDEARMMVYSGAAINKDLYSFGTLLSKELSDRVEVLPGVVMIFPDLLLNVLNVNIGDENEIPIPLYQLDKSDGNDLARGELI